MTPAPTPAGAHTPTPWTNDEHSVYVWSKEGNVCVCGDPTADTIVGYTEAGRSTAGLHAAVANAHHIVHCVNNHAALVAALEWLVRINPSMDGFAWDAARTALQAASQP